jgi:phospholipid/cholesterol/gamma-HCH transport system substrate-binding protein
MFLKHSEVKTMQITSPEVKVGAFSLLALVAMFGLSLWLNGSQLFQRGYDVEAVFSRIEGLRPGAPVKFAGVDIGRVTKIYFEDFKVIVGMRIEPSFRVPHSSKAMISSSGVIGDMFIEIIPPKPDEKLEPRNDNRIQGQTPVTVEQFYASAYSVLNSLEQIVDSIKNVTDNPEVMKSIKQSLVRLNTITSDIEQVTTQFRQMDLAQLFKRIDNTMTIVERLAVNNEPQINQLLQNITLASVQLTQASITANQFLKNLDNNGQTAEDLRTTIAQAKIIAENLEKFTAIIAAKDKDLDMLINDAHQTLQSINQAAQSINKLVTELTTGKNDLSKVKQIIADTSSAAAKISKSVNNLAQFSVKSGLGLEYQPEQPVAADLMLDMSFNEQNSLFLGMEDIGGTNLATVQWGFKAPSTIGRAGLYKNQFGLGLDFAATSGIKFGIDIWNTHSPNLGLSSTLKITPNWSLRLNGSGNFDSQTYNWGMGCWYNF